METSQRQISLFTEEELTSSQADSLANPTQQQGYERERKMTDISGRKCLEQLGKFSHVGLWEKTFTALLIGQAGWYSTRCKLTWKLRATRSHRFYFQLAVSTLPTDGIGFGLLPTAREASARGNCSNDRKRGNLEDAIASGLLPTPNQRDYKGRTGSGWTQQSSLPNTLLPTPATRDHKGVRSEEALQKAGRNETNSLPDAFSQTGKTSQLNPLFVAEMMGFPTDWTILPFQSGETNQSKLTETQ